MAVVDGENGLPTVTLSCSAALAEQVLMDELWDRGFRPSEGLGSAGALAATQQHLEDMRRIAFRYIEWADD